MMVSVVLKLTDKLTGKSATVGNAVLHNIGTGCIIYIGTGQKRPALVGDA